MVIWCIDGRAMEKRRPPSKGVQPENANFRFADQPPSYSPSRFRFPARLEAN
jgi:hypothetical protein